MSNMKTYIKTDTPDLETICRLCLQPQTGTVNIFSSGPLWIPVRIMACAALEVQPTDGLPKLICEKCRFQLEKFYYFRKKCQSSDMKLRKHIRLVNAGRKSRVFVKSDDDEDDEDSHLNESLKFIQEIEAKHEREEAEKRIKWLEVEQENFRKEETQRLFEEFGNFVNSRKPLERNATVKRERVTFEISEVVPQKIAPVKQKKVENEAKRPRVSLVNRKIREETPEEVDDQEITSSEQIGDDQEQILIYDEDAENPDGIQTFFLYGKNDGDEHQIIEIESERLEELDDELNRDEEANALEERAIHIAGTDEDGSEDYMFATEYEECESKNGDEGQLDEVNIVQSYQIEENGEIQYLKDETAGEAISVSEEDEGQNALSGDIMEYQIEQGSEVISSSKQKRKSKTDQTSGTQKEAKKTKSPARGVSIQDSKILKCKPPSFNRESPPVIAVNYAKISTEDLKIFKCSECPQSFTRETSLIRHRSAHKKGREYSCDRCDKWFSCKSSLDRHIRIHTGEKPFTCEQCGKSYMQKEVLKRHLAIHSGKRPHPCPHCPRAFVQKLMLTQHINATHLEVPQIQKHDCHLCPKSFHHASGLSRHLITHSGMKFQCSECGRSFNDKSSIRRHVMSVHAKVKDRTIIGATKVSSKDEYIM